MAFFELCPSSKNALEIEILQDLRGIFSVHPSLVMSVKLSPEGKFIPFRGWTTISPVRYPQVPRELENDASQICWTKTLTAALSVIRSSACAANFACLPEDSMHMTLVGLTEEVKGEKPTDMPVRRKVQESLFNLPLNSFRPLNPIVRYGY